jgi:cyclase
MVRKRIIPCLDVKDGRTVKGTNFIQLRDAGDPVELASRYSDGGADELVFLDISATLEGRSTFVRMVERVAESVRITFMVGGGIGTVDDIRRVLNAGADKVSLNSAVLSNPHLIDDAASAVGGQSVVVAIDVRQHGASWMVWTKAGTEATGRDAIEWAREVVERGAGEILVTSMDRDGTKQGYDIPLLQAMHAAVSVPVVASGGAGTMQHVREAFIEGRADAVLAASIFHYREIEIPALKEFLRDAGIVVRI